MSLQTKVFGISLATIAIVVSTIVIIRLYGTKIPVVNSIG